MTDKEAIEILKHLKEVFIVCDCDEAKHREAEAIDTILLSYEVLCNELDKKNKEIEEATYIINKYGGVSQLEQYIWDLSKYLGDISIDCMLQNIKNNYIPKSKIQEKIDELENEQDNLDNHHFIYSEYEMYRKIIFILEDFFKGEDE